VINPILKNIENQVSEDMEKSISRDSIYQYYPRFRVELENSEERQQIVKAFELWQKSVATLRIVNEFIRTDVSNPNMPKLIESANIFLNNQYNNFFEIYKTLKWNSKRILKAHTEIYTSLTHTPELVRDNPFVNNYLFRQEDGKLRLREDEFSITITKEMLGAPSGDNTIGLNIKETLEYKASKYAISTAGFRARQNKLFPWDYRERFNMFGEIITAYSQIFVMVIISNYSDTNAQDIHSKLLSFLDEKYSNLPRSVALFQAIHVDHDMFAKEAFDFLCLHLHKVISSEVRFNSEIYEDIYSRISSANGITVHMPPNGVKSSIWMTSYVIFTNDYNGGNYFTSSHARDDYQCSKDLSDEGAQFLPDVSLQFAEVNKAIVEHIERLGDFTINFSGSYSPKIKRDVDGTDEYFEMMKSSVITEENHELVNDSVENGWTGIVQDYVGACMYPIMNKLFQKSGYSDIVFPINSEYDPFQEGIGKEYIVKKKNIYNQKFDIIGQIDELVYDDQGVDASLAIVVDRMGYDEKLIGKPIGTIISNTDPDGDRLVCSEILANSEVVKLELKQYGISYIELDNQRLLSYYSPNKMFLMTTAFYLDSLIKSGRVSSDDSIIIIKTAQTSFAFNEYVASIAKKLSLNIHCIEPTVGFKEIAAVERKIEKQILENEKRVTNGESPKDVILQDSLGNEFNLGTERVVLISASEESGGQELAPPTGMLSKNLKRFAIGNREKSASVASYITIPFGAMLYENNWQILDYWKNLIVGNNLKFIRDSRADILLFDPGTPDPEEYALSEKKGNDMKIRNSAFWWNLARHFADKYIDIALVKKELKEIFIEIDAKYIDELLFVKPVLTDSDNEFDRAKDGVYMMFSNFYIAIRPSGTDPKIKGYYSGHYSPEIGSKIANAFASFDPTEKQLNPPWLARDYYKSDPYK
jgi:phosphomannomutase